MSSNNDLKFKEKYLKYKNKYKALQSKALYLNLIKHQKQLGGASASSLPSVTIDVAIRNRSIDGPSTGHIMNGVQIIILLFDDYLLRIKDILSRMRGGAPRSFSDYYDPIIWSALSNDTRSPIHWQKIPEDLQRRIELEEYLKLLHIIEEMKGNISWVKYAKSVLEDKNYIRNGTQLYKGNDDESSQLVLNLADRYHRQNGTRRLTEEDLIARVGVSNPLGESGPRFERQSSFELALQQISDSESKSQKKYDILIDLLNNKNISMNAKFTRIFDLLFADPSLINDIDKNESLYKRLNGEGILTLAQYNKIYYRKYLLHMKK
jgi:hypothetical protein